MAKSEMRMGYLLFTKEGKYFTFIETYVDGRMESRTRQEIPNSVIEDAVFNYVRSLQNQDTPARELVAV